MRQLIHLVSACLLLLHVTTLYAAQPSQLAVVFIDDASEAKYGSVPVDRRLLADAIEKLADAGARGVILKFFIDRNKDTAGDVALQAAMKRLPVLLQARLDDAELNANPLPSRFTVPQHADTALTGRSGWIPTAEFAAFAHDVGFVDYAGLPVSLLERYQGKTVKSLLLSAAELLLADTAVIVPGESISIGDRVFEVDKMNRVRLQLDYDAPFDYLPLQDVLESGGWNNQVDGKVVLLGYDGASLPMVEVGGKRIRSHRLFALLLRALVADE